MNEDYRQGEVEVPGKEGDKWGGTRGPGSAEGAS